MIMLFKSNNYHRQTEQSGFVSLIVAALIMVIISLITIGFTKIMQREQRQALDRQLSRQALYAAESGINDVYEALKNNPNYPAEKTDCNVTDKIGPLDNPAINGGIMQAESGVAYTCVLYDKTPTELNYELSTSESTVTLLKSDSGNNFSTINIRWAQKDGVNGVSSLPDCSDAGVFPSSRPGVVPLIRFDLTDISTLKRDNLILNTANLYLSPCTGGSGVNSIAFDTTNRGQVVPVGCIDATNYVCTLTLTMPGSSNSYSARMRSVYDTAKLAISAQDTSNLAIEFKQSQTSIDVTAKANDIVRRLRVAVPLGEAKNLPEAVFQAFDGICKQLEVGADTSGNATIANNCF